MTATVLAATGLAAMLRKIIGTHLILRTNTEALERVILIGSGEAAQRWVADVPFNSNRAGNLRKRSKAADCSS